MDIMTSSPHHRETPCDDDHVAAWLNLSHELRTPTNAILGHVELLLSGSAGPIPIEMRTSLGEIQKAAVAMASQIGTIVKLAEGLPVPNARPTLSPSDLAE